jgi:hypothetical protein
VAFPKANREEQRDIQDLLLILGDSDGGKARAGRDNDVVEALRRRFDQLNAVDRNRRVEQLRRVYNWPALRRVILSSPRQSASWRPSRIISDKSTAISLQDLFNLLDLHIQANVGFHAPDPNSDEGRAFLLPYELPAARRTLQLLIILQFVLGYRWLLQHRSRLQPYQQFAESLARLMQAEGQALASQGIDPRTRKYYLFGYSLVSMNWDPMLIWLVFNAHARSNLSVVRVGRPPRPQKLFNDLAYLVVRKVEGEDLAIWYMMNESTAQRLNDPKHSGDRYVRTGKFYFPHGSTNLRECPNCGKMNAYLGDEWKLLSPSLFPPMPIVDWSKQSRKARSEEEEMGYTDALQCVYCGAMMGFEQISLLMQTNFKTTMSPYLEETQRELRAALENARHIILMGYSLAKDDVLYRSGSRPGWVSERKRRDASTYRW